VVVPVTSLAVIGDVHGESRRLRSMLATLESFDGTIVFVGDYVDGGADSAEVLEILSGLSGSQPGRFRFLCGNHDLALLRYIKDGEFARFCAMAGLPTLASYLPVVSGDVHAAFVSALPARHVAFLRGLEAAWETDEILVSHAGYDPARPAARDIETMAHGTGWPIFGDVRPPKELVVCGHYVQTRGPYASEHLVCVDTGCGIIPGAPLTAVILPERRFVSLT
jgi:serine/threonine protein phosphatase 1